MTRQRWPYMQGPEGRPPNVSPARKGWEIDPEEDPSAGGAALNRSSALPVSLGAYPDFLHHRSNSAAYVVLSRENHTQSTEAATLNRKSGGAQGSAVPRTPRGNVFLSPTRGESVG